MDLTREQIVEALKSNVCKVTFTKLNGEVREMPCTLREDIVPVYERKTPIKEAVAPADETESSPTISVWCIDKQGWRSFHWANVTKIEIDLGMPIVSV